MDELEAYLTQLNIGYKFFLAEKVFHTHYFNVRIKKVKTKYVYEFFDKLDYSRQTIESLEKLQSMMRKSIAFNSFK